MTVLENLRKEYPYLYETHLHTSEASACARFNRKRNGAGLQRRGVYRHYRDQPQLARKSLHRPVSSLGKMDPRILPWL